jgi:hypothetical protein
MDPIRPWPKGRMIDAVRAEITHLEERIDFTRDLLRRCKLPRCSQIHERGTKIIAERQRRIAALRWFLARRKGGAA